MKTKIFALNGIVGIESSLDCEGIVNLPWLEESIKVDASYVRISKDALDILKTLKPGTDDENVGISIKKGEDGSTIHWGYVTKMAFDNTIPTNTDYDPSGLVASEEEVEIPQDFKDMIDQIINESIN